MVLITYNTGCRNCLNTDDIRHVYQIIEGDEKDFLCQTEFEVMRLIEKWRKQDNHTCGFCGSDNVEILNVEVNDEPLYEYEMFVKRCKKKHEFMFQINIDKRGSEYSMNQGGNNDINTKFIKLSLIEIYKSIKSRQDNYFQSNQNGNMFICVTGGVNSKDNKPYTRTESFRSAGLLKKQIFSMLKIFENKVGINIDLDSIG